MSRVLVAFALALALPLFAHAQGALATIAMDPEFAPPGSTVTFRISSTNIDLSRSTIEWLVDGSLVDEGVGLTSIRATLSEAGEPTDVRASIVSDEVSTSVSTTVTPAIVDLVWESRGLTPPFYAGRALPASGARLTFAALPVFGAGSAAVPVRDLTFTWRKGSTVLGSLSGKGKSTLTIDSPLLIGSDTISVEVRSPSGATARASTRVSSERPTILLYEHHPLFGTLFHKLIPSNAEIDDTERTLIAYPLFAPASSVHDRALEYRWIINRSEVGSDGEKPSEITINSAGSEGLALIELDVHHGENPFYSASGIWRIQFARGGDTSGGADDPFAPSEQ